MKDCSKTVLARRSLLRGTLATLPALVTNRAAKSEEQAITLRLAWVYDMAEVGLFVAQDEGYFAQEGFTLSIEPGGFGLDPLKLVAVGTNDFGVAGAGNLLLARARGVPVVAIGVEFQNTPVAFIVRETSDIHSFREFRGKRVGVQTGADTDVVYRALLVRNGMTSADVREIPIQYDVTPFVADRIDVLPGYVTNQPIALRARGIAVRVISAASQGLEYYGNVYIASEKLLRDRPDVVRKFLYAARKGWITALSNKAGSIAAVQRRAGDFSVSNLGMIYEAVVPFIRFQEGQPGLMVMTQRKWNTTAQVLEDAGLLKVGPDLLGAYTNEYLP